jgi:hypothetical protein
MNNITILNNILPSLLPILPRRLNRRHALRPVTQIAEIIVRNDLGFYEAPLEIGMNRACGLWCQTAFGNRPATDLFLTCLGVVRSTCFLWIGGKGVTDL